MKINRRKLLAGATAGALLSLSQYEAEAWPRHNKPTGITNFNQLLLGGGGFATDIEISQDGLTKCMHGDTNGAFVINSTSNGIWDRKDRAPYFTYLNGGCHAICPAPNNSNIIYCVMGTRASDMPSGGFGAGGRAFGYMSIHKSLDAGATWTTTAMLSFQGSWGDGDGRFAGSKIAIDPNNNNIVYISNATGVVFVTYNGGANWHTVDDLFAALGTAVVSADATVNGSAQNISVTSNTVTTAVQGILNTGLPVYAYNRDAPNSIGSNGFGLDSVNGANSTAFSINFTEPRVFGGNTANGQPAVSATGGPGGTGDRIYFGCGASIAIDGSNGTVANPGIALGDPGTAGTVASKYVYVGYRAPTLSPSFWWSNNGGVSGSWAAMGGTTPFNISRLRMSNDAALVGGGNVLYTVDNSSNSTDPARNAWRYVGVTPPTGSGLTANTWTYLAASSGSGHFGGIAPDPTQAGHVGFFVGSGAGGACTALSTDYGNSVSFVPNLQNAYNEIPAGQPGWQAQANGVDGHSTGGGCCMDASGQMWVTDGIGIFRNPIRATTGLGYNSISTAVQGIMTLSAPADWQAGDWVLIYTANGGSTTIPPAGFIVQIVTRTNATTYVLNLDTTINPASGGGTVVLQSRFIAASAGIESLIPQAVMKAKAPNGRVYVACQDRPIFTLSNLSNYPSSYNPKAVSTIQSGDVVASDSDPTVMFSAAASEIFRSQDKGDTWVCIAGSMSISGISKTNPAVVNIGSSGNFVVDVGCTLKFENVGGMTQINGLTGTVTAIGTGTATVNIDSSGFSVYTGGGDCIINGWIGGGGNNGSNPKLASISPSSLMAQPSSSANSNIQYAVGSSNLNLGKNWFWNPTLYLGSPVTSLAYSPLGYLNNQKMIMSDGFGTYFYLWQGSPISWYKSIDGGATFTLKQSGSNLNNAVVGNGGIIVPVPGKIDNFFSCAGVNFAFSGPFPYGLGRSIDGGSTWTVVSNFYYAYQVTCGAPKPGGGGYPAIFAAGLLNIGETPCLYRSDDNCTSWVKLPNFNNVMYDLGRCIGADPDNYGGVFVGGSSSGFAYGTIN